MTTLQLRRAALLAKGFRQLDTCGSRWTCYQRGTARNNVNVDLGPAGGATCWIVTAVGATVTSTRVSFDDFMELPLA